MAQVGGAMGRLVLWALASKACTAGPRWKRQDAVNAVGMSGRPLLDRKESRCGAGNSEGGRSDGNGRRSLDMAQGCPNLAGDEADRVVAQKTWPAVGSCPWGKRERPRISTCKTYIKCSQILKDSIR
ncbi:hypothetical protein TRIUR3_14657 [Triticum urartu]|uniref:Secreted protein n=1 Tax=Triticum urartu TaxID=4572 RepID=M7ZBR3_TRIUA|nr:hypothetical protein TRIUR3_14657 [Triticum urartu]